MSLGRLIRLPTNGGVAVPLARPPPAAPPSLAGAVAAVADSVSFSDEVCNDLRALAKQFGPRGAPKTSAAISAACRSGITARPVDGLQSGDPKGDGPLRVLAGDCEATASSLAAPCLRLCACARRCCLGARESLPALCCARLALRPQSPALWGPLSSLRRARRRRRRPFARASPQPGSRLGRQPALPAGTCLPPRWPTTRPFAWPPAPPLWAAARRFRPMWQPPSAGRAREAPPSAAALRLLGQEETAPRPQQKAALKR